MEQESIKPYSVPGPAGLGKCGVNTRCETEENALILRLIRNINYF